MSKYPPKIKITTKQMQRVADALAYNRLTNRLAKYRERRSLRESSKKAKGS